MLMRADDGGEEKVEGEEKRQGNIEENGEIPRGRP